MTQSRYLIGIDLGTTNCVLAYLDTRAPERGPQVLSVPQWETPASTVESETLPSFNYLATAAERQAGFAAETSQAPALEGGWVPGAFARGRMAHTPGRVIHSAKSWLCHGGIDRTAPILPWHSEDVPPAERLSPVRASSAYLAYLKQAWDRSPLAAEPRGRFEHQEVVVTVPASFDEAAQQLTLEAAQQAGYPQTIRLIEEPQAAFYDWLGRGRNISTLLDLLETVPDKVARVVVFDIGGGTTDLSLFEVRGDRKSPTGLSLNRVAVSEHLLLGGDNIDLTLAYLLEHKLTGGRTKLSGGQWNQLLVQARELKERILRDEGEGAPEPGARFTVTLAGSGAGLFASTLSAEVSAEEVRQTVLEGFFPACTAEERPRKKGGGLREWGLPYAEDTAATRHLAAFLEGQRIDAVLYNGGSVTPAFLRRRLTDLLTGWQGGREPMVLVNDAMALAVARGAARYGYILQRPEAGQRIAGGHAHALYLEVTRGGRGKKSSSLVCVLPKGMEANQSVRIDNAEFDLLVNQPVRFQCFFSNRRTGDAAGEVIPWREDQFHPLPQLQTAIHLPPERPKPANNRLRVTLECALNEIGLLQLYCVEKDGSGRWRLDFNLRKPIGQEEQQEVVEEPLVPRAQLAKAEALVLALYGKKKDPELPDLKPRQLMRELEKTLGGTRDEWDGATLRALWPTIAQGMTRRSRSVDHEEAWLYLAGFALRPGYGFALDESRIEELWRLYDMGMAFPREKRVQVQWYLLWRRAAGGLNARRQEKILAKLLPQLPALAEQTQEVLYLVGSLERVRLDLKLQLVKQLGGALRKAKVRNKLPSAWALGRLLSRTPLYAGPDAILPPQEVEKLFGQVRDLDWKDPAYAPLVPLFAQAARRTDRRGIDLDPELRRQVLDKLKEAGARPEELQVVREMVPVEDADRVRQFGESLPGGLILVREAGNEPQAD
ncbi:molecular chaperone DnaK [Desulfuromonas versatilis]|uniref:Molecular chaperone DnaK n=1 Tax=Desulfuromonas versatilis TaxID=2802975 RepID=A0ABM8HS13_9BACT|nr:hsp70 family protein [Desulfuromonas versatilis]BCR03236.1 molecular chaperone DnaK [Desulfuromonas versatilis]